MEIWKSQELSHVLIYLTFPVLHQYITAALNQLIESIIPKYEYI